MLPQLGEEGGDVREVSFVDGSPVFGADDRVQVFNLVPDADEGFQCGFDGRADGFPCGGGGVGGDLGDGVLDGPNESVDGVGDLRRANAGKSGEGAEF